MQRVRRTLGSNCSWQYFSAVSEIASSSSVNRFWELRGSCQSNGGADEAAAAKFRLAPACSEGALRRAHLESRALDMVARMQFVPQRVERREEVVKGIQPGSRGCCPSSLHLLHRSCPVSGSVTPTTARDGNRNLGSSTVAPCLGTLPQPLIPPSHAHFGYWQLRETSSHWSQIDPAETPNGSNVVLQITSPFASSFCATHTLSLPLPV